MENAGAEAAREALALLERRRGRVILVCGPGGNGGDALVVARRLAIAGVPVEIATFGGEPAGDAAVQLHVCRAMGLRIREVRQASDAAALFDGAPPALVVDGLYGTGLTRALDGVAAALVDAMNACGAPILALDVPSGLDCDTGEPLGPCVRASVTVTFVAEKTGFANPASRAFTGEIRVASNGAPLDRPPRD